MGKGALIIGGGVAGTQAALDLANSGIEVHLVEPTPFLGGNGSTTVPQHLLNSRLLEVAKHPKVTYWTNTRVNRTWGEAGDFYVELRQHPRYVDLSKCTACKECLAVCPVTVPGSDQKAIHLTASAQPACAAINKLGKAPCANTCPGGIHVQGYVALIAQGRFQEAIDLIREAIPFPGICGRICTHPCEVNCRRAEVDKPVAIRLLKRFVSDWELIEPGPNSEPPSEIRNSIAPASLPAAGRVAIVGAGPGGMAVADRLARLGYGVTVFEKLPIIGGMMAMGIPEYRLPREVIAREYRQIQELGVQVRLNTAIGPDGDYSLDDLFAMGYLAVCLAVGAHKSHALRLSGEGLPGVVQGIELLTTISLSQQMGTVQYEAELQRILCRGSETRAAVLGGGNTAMDVARCLRRHGIREVRILYRRTRAEMPALPEEIEEAEREGIPIEFLVAPLRFVGDTTTGVTALHCQRMKLGEPDASGRRRPVPIAGSEFIIDLDLVVLAIGQAPDLGFLGANHTMAITREERINVDAVSFMTSRPGVFAVGDAVTTDKMAVIEAIGMGKKAAAAIDAYIKNVPPHEIVVDAREVPIARREMTSEELAPKPRTLALSIPMAERLSSYAEVELGYTAQQAVSEAQRCLVCGPCSECLACVRACKPGAVVHDQQERFVELQVGAVICADDSARAGEFPYTSGGARQPAHGVYRVPPGECHSPLLGSAAAARAMFDLFAERSLLSAPRATSATPDLEMQAAEPRIGVFVCECGDQIASVVDTQTVCDRAALWPDVVHTGLLPFSCSPQATEVIDQAIATHSLNRIVLAACSCCSIDQVCYSCTYQRVRCKENLGVFAHAETPIGGQGDKGARGQSVDPPDDVRPAVVEFVNIREQCAWVHAHDPRGATAKATALVAAAVSRARLAAPGVAGERRPVDRSVLILGSGAAGRACARALGAQGIAATRLPGMPVQIGRASGTYFVADSGRSWPAGALVLTPRDASEAGQLLAAFGGDGHRPRALIRWGGVETHRPGVFLCDPSMPAESVGAAVAARVAAWLGQEAGTPAAGSTALAITATVDPARCRACATCVELCEFGAPQLVGQEPRRTSWIDPAICTGCGTCAAHCPSGAITPGYATEKQLEGLLEQVAGCVVILTCNWNAYSGLESAGVEHLAYPAATRPIKVLCLGQLNPGLVLKALEKGAEGVLLLGCPPGECHYNFGERHAEETFADAKQLATLLGFRDQQLQLDWVAAGQGEELAAKVQAFFSGLHGG